MAASDPRIGATFERAGLTLLSPRQGLRLLHSVMQHASAAQTLAVRVRWSRLLAQQRPVPGIFSAVLAAETAAQPLPAAVPASSRVAVQQPQPAVPASSARASAAASVTDLQHSILDIVRGMLGHPISLDEVSTHA